MIRIEKKYKADTIFTENQDNTWDKKRDKTFTVRIFGIVIYRREEHLDIDYGRISDKKIGYR